jgi:Leucine-rich repeat (LRR) protein
MTRAHTLNRNHLTDTLPDVILALTNLTRLNLHSNQLRHLPRIGDLQKLSDLRASDNALQSLPPSIGTLTDLRTLEVSFNQLVMLPEELSSCRHLVAIRARGNELKTLPVGITSLSLARARARARSLCLSGSLALTR